MKHLLGCAVLLASNLLFAQSAAIPDNQDLTKLYNADQSERKGPDADWNAVYHHDIDRREQLRRMLADGKVDTGLDYYHAAMIFQHGQNPDDFLFAHVLAVTAVSKGNLDARWLCAATLDRYLRSIWQPQIYGTQYQMTPEKQWVRQAMNETLISDSMRAAACVVSLAKQKQNLAGSSESKPPGSTSVEDCPK